MNSKYPGYAISNGIFYFLYIEMNVAKNVDIMLCKIDPTTISRMTLSIVTYSITIK